jgi:hypothetical protein
MCNIFISIKRFFTNIFEKLFSKTQYIISIQSDKEPLLLFKENGKYIETELTTENFNNLRRHKWKSRNVMVNHNGKKRCFLTLSKRKKLNILQYLEVHCLNTDSVLDNESNCDINTFPSYNSRL